MHDMGKGIEKLKNKWSKIKRERCKCNGDHKGKGEDMSSRSNRWQWINICNKIKEEESKSYGSPNNVKRQFKGEGYYGNTYFLKAYW